MFISKNIQYLRRINGNITQETLAEKLDVSRQSVSKWESGESIPDMDRLIALCEIFSCKMDALVREDLSDRNSIYSPITIREMPALTMARYVMISPNPESDVQNYMRNWGKVSGLLTAHPDSMLIGWDFPFVSIEQQSRFGLHGYAAAYILPEGFSPACPGAEVFSQPAAKYAVCTIKEPFIAPFERIPGAYQRLMDYLSISPSSSTGNSDILGCFEHEYERDGTSFMDVYVLMP